jgi:hypothetical protein
MKMSKLTITRETKGRSSEGKMYKKRIKRMENGTRGGLIARYRKWKQFLSQYNPH